MGFSSLAVMANSLLLQLEGRRSALPPQPRPVQQAQQAQQQATGGGKGEQQQQAANGTPSSPGHIAPI